MKREFIRGKISVITPSYNAERFIEETIKSVLNQDYENLEMIIVDDCSTDSTEKVVRRFSEQDKRVKFIKLEKNSGAAVTRNKALEIADGQHVAFLDSDDIWKKNKLRKQLDFMREKNIGFSFTGYELINEDGKKLDKLIKVPEEITYKKLLKNTIIGCLTVVIDREKIGDFRMPLVRAGQDTATWLSILRQGHIAYGLDENLSEYRIVTGSISSNKIKALKRTWNTYRNLEKLHLIKCIYYFICYVNNAILKRFIKKRER
ncbi:MAG: glycosyltransferase family 2 protein [Clostridium sp.]|uniref:glycosyltransferase family 2 protein n=1 Tax=Clostridium sp. TaxID=1506 RepID=UPI003F340F58